MNRQDVVGPFEHPAFRWLAAGRFAHYLGNAVAPVALAFAVLDLTGSVADLGLVVGARSLANVLLLLGGGVLADRLPRGLVLQGGAVAAGGTQALVAALVLTGTASVPALAALSALNGAVAGLSIPAALSITPLTVPAGLLRQANAVLRIGTNAGLVTGAALAGVLVAVVGPGWGIAVDAATFLLSSLCFARVRVRPATSTPDTSGTSALTDLREGWTEFRSRQWVWAVVLQFMVVNAVFSGANTVLGPAVADDTVGRSQWGLVMAALTAGFVLGGVLALRWQPRRLLAAGVALTAGAALPLLGLGWWPVLPVLLVAYLVCGLCFEQFGVAWDVAMQEHVPQDRLARVYSYDALGSLVAIPLGQVVAGPLAEAVGRRATLTGAAVAVVLATLACLASPQVRALVRARDQGADASVPSLQPQTV